jgi:hypothetical protein
MTTSTIPNGSINAPTDSASRFESGDYLGDKLPGLWRIWQHSAD